jgi:hypothetical protein
VESGSRPAAGLPPLSTPGRALPYQDPQGVGASAPTSCGAQRLPFAAQFPRAVAFAALRCAGACPRFRCDSPAAYSQVFGEQES